MTRCLVALVCLGAGLGCSGLLVDHAGLTRVTGAVAAVDPAVAVPLYIQGGTEVGLVNPVCARCLAGLAAVDPEQRSTIAARALLEESCLCPGTCASRTLPNVAGDDPARRMEAIGRACDADGPDPVFAGPLGSLRGSAPAVEYAVVRMLAEATGDGAEVEAVRHPLAIGLALDGTPALEPTASPVVVGAPESLLTDHAEAIGACGEDVAHRLIVDPDGAVVAVGGAGTCVRALLGGWTLEPTEGWRAVDLAWQASAAALAAAPAAPPDRPRSEPRPGPAPAATPQARSGGTQVSGALDKSVVDAVFKRNLNLIRFCYEQALAKDPTAQGTVQVSFTIGADGSVAAASARSTLGPDLEACVLARVRQMLFPQPGDGGLVSVNYPVVFSGG